MRIAFLVFNLDGMGGTSRSAISQANALVERHDVHLLSVTRSGEVPHYPIDSRITVDYLVDLRDEDAPAAEHLEVVGAEALALHHRPSLLVPARWDAQFTALCDVALEVHLPAVDADVLVTVTPGLLAAAEQLVPDRVALVHQEHRSSSDRVSGLEPLLTFGPRADLVVLLTEATATWLRGELGALTPPLVVMPNPLPQGFVPRSRLDEPVIVAAGRLVSEKQLGHLVRAFAQVADRLPGWRLRIFGDGPARNLLQALGRKAGLYGRLELPGISSDMPGEWAKASVAALTSRAEGYPLVMQEAMAAGVPVVSYDCPSGPREIIDHEVNGLLVTPGSEAALATALHRLGADVELRRRLGEAAAVSARRWRADLLATRWEQLFADAVARRDPGVRRLAQRHASPGSQPDTTPAALTGEREDGAITPAQARRQVLAIATSTADEVTDEWFVVPPVGDAPPAVVVPGPDRGRYLAALARASVPGYLSLRDPGDHGWPERRGTVPELAAALAGAMTSRISLEPWPDTAGGAALLGRGCAVEVQFWDDAVDGDLVAPVPNPYLARVPRGAATATRRVEGLDLPTLPLMTHATVGEPTVPVDVVYTWVDGADPAWAERQQARLAASSGVSETAGDRASSGRARFESRDELRYSMRSLHLFAPWVRTVHVVTDGQVPPWLDVDHPQVHLVDHRDILPDDALPTFNSHAIETALHRIPGLAEHFVYLNDDMLLARPLGPDRFFDSAGRFAVFTSRHPVGLARAGDPAYVTAALHNRRLLEDAFGVTVTHHLAHAPDPQRVSVLAEIAERFADEVTATSRAPFRSGTDVSLVSSLAQHYGLVTGTAYAAGIDSVFVDLSSTKVSLQLDQLLGREQDAICLGDHHDYAFEVARVDRLLAEFLQTYYPIAAPWER
ncbi:MAG: stealth conserved region 3 domain-containing protein [Nocardioides sp.]